MVLFTGDCGRWASDSRIDAQDKRARTRLCPYLSRPPVATKHLRRYRYGKLIYILKRQ
ncbi:MAG: transposase [Myxococcales bacterium]|nr:MAG: transposase [Myxococcales bacterium]